MALSSSRVCVELLALLLLQVSGLIGPTGQLAALSAAFLFGLGRAILGNLHIMQIQSDTSMAII